MKEDVESVKNDVEKIASLLEGVRIALARIAGEDTGVVLEPPEWMKDKLRVWAGLYDEGGIVEQAKLHEIAKAIGYDPRGLAGFFKGKGSLVWVGKTGEKKVALSSWATEEVERYRDWLEDHRRKKKK